MDTSITKKHLIICFFISIFFASCNFSIDKVNSAYWTNSIQESKEMGLFIHKYDTIFVQINDTIKFHIDEAWCERQIWHSNLDENNKLIEMPKIFYYQLILKIRENDTLAFARFNEDWRIEKMDYLSADYGHYLVAYDSNLVSSKILPDSLEIKLVYSIPSKIPNEFDKIEHLGSFYLYKKE